jgi:hypothetical protein
VTGGWPPSAPLEPGVGFPELEIGTSRDDVTAYLGESTGEHADGRVLSWMNLGVLVRLDSIDRVESITLGAVFAPDGLSWPDVTLPPGLAWQALLTDVRDLLGDPIDFATGEVVPGSGRRHHIVRWPGLRLTFDDHGRLTSVSVP